MVGSQVYFVGSFTKGEGLELSSNRIRYYFFENDVLSSGGVTTSTKIAKRSRSRRPLAFVVYRDAWDQGSDLMVVVRPADYKNRCQSMVEFTRDRFCKIHCLAVGSITGGIMRLGVLKDINAEVTMVVVARHLNIVLVKEPKIDISTLTWS